MEKIQFTDEQLCQIRDEFALICERTQNAGDELDIINVCQRLLEDPVFKDFDEFKKDTSGSWSEIRIEDEDEDETEDD